MFVNGVEIRKFRAKDSQINAPLFCFGNISKKVLANNMKKTGL